MRAARPGRAEALRRALHPRGTGRAAPTREPGNAAGAPETEQYSCRCRLRARLATALAGARGSREAAGHGSPTAVSADDRLPGRVVLRRLPDECRFRR